VKAAEQVCITFKLDAETTRLCVATKNCKKRIEKGFGKAAAYGKIIISYEKEI